jgi:hypothetical protein
MNNLQKLQLVLQYLKMITKELELSDEVQAKLRDMLMQESEVFRDIILNSDK